MAEAEATTEIAALDENDVEPDQVPGYKAPAKKTIEQLQNMDAEDESLVNYKAALLKIDDGAKPADDPRRVIVESMSLVVEGRDDTVLDLTGDLKGFKMVVKEGAEYRIKIGFKIHHEIVPGLRYHHVVKRNKLPVDKQTYMVGSYGPRSESYDWTQSIVEEAPKGMISRGVYKIQSKFIDDDKEVHLEWNWDMEIKKDWV